MRLHRKSGGLAFEFEDDIKICSESRKQEEENIERWRLYHINERCKGQLSRATESLEEKKCADAYAKKLEQV